jgi:hypothetical protein
MFAEVNWEIAPYIVNLPTSQLFYLETTVYSISLSAV